jgi:hypothetical protein
MRRISIAVLALCLCFSLVNVGCRAKQKGTPPNYTDIVVAMAKIASKPNLTWKQVMLSLSQVRWIHGPKLGDKSIDFDNTISTIRPKELGRFSHYAEGDITIKVNESKLDIFGRLDYLDGEWQVIVIGSETNPKIIELILDHDPIDDRVRLVDLIMSTNELSLTRCKCDFKTEFTTFGNVVYRIKLKNNRSLFLKEEWNCNRFCTQALAFFVFEDLVEKIKCGADIMNNPGDMGD